MTFLLLGLHVAVCVVLVAVSALRPGRVVFALGAIPPAITAVWAVTRLAGDGPDVAHDEVSWVAGLDLELVFRVDPLSSLLVLIVSGIGAGVFVYAAGYFSAGAAGLTRFAATLLAFSAAMVGLVLADSVWTLFVFWELTSITSYLLVGFKHADAGARNSARRALLITAAGGLVLLAGTVVLVDGAGTARLSELGPVGGTTGAVAAVLVLVAAATKSAQVPFHVWLPGAMAAPTPVSAYLHSATMVKAGVILVLLLQPALGDTGPWAPLGMTFGLVSMVWGAIGALRHVDAKLILAWGTVSQLGLMIALLAAGSGKATFAAVSILVAHAVFKAALFMVVGEVDVRAGTRDIRRLRGLRRSMPIAFAVAVVSGASMAGVPPLLGFAAKEAAIEGALGLSGAERVVMLVGVVGGSVLTVAYTLRFLVGVFGDRVPTEPGSAPADTVVSPRRPAITAVTSVLGAASVLGFVALGTVSDLARDAAVVVNDGSAVYELLRWPGLTTGFLISMGIVVVGAALGWWLAVGRRAERIPRPIGADAVDGLVAAVLSGARLVAGRVQHGSLPVYMVTMAVVAAATAVPFVVDVDVAALDPWDHALQPALVALVVLAAFGTLRVPGRLGAALGLGAIGFAVAGLFVLQGAPDLALTQLLVETVVVVGFVIGLGRLGSTFPPVGQGWRSVRIAASVLVGLAVAVGLAASAADPAGEPPLDALDRRAVEPGGGNNIVNVILTDMRALDTLGEIIVLAVVAVGIASLARASRTDDPTAATLPGEGAADLADRAGAGAVDRSGRAAGRAAVVSSGNRSGEAAR